ncbi:hypothetical protein PEX1_020240 [Penicillium expansum]|uniref:Uncharacterized protein n=1 Tax=Penicillium expansum TaxID=27334 RepID=A0A0A2J2P8_PENEN|nr:hypothetical protein PEX2_106490 [Penicillium expansum]KGO40308.1 hypothetical protein PEXP_031230 [Penicillium expansum]KGO49627.1 hypothetical protein PEX2_106490 [Penicillium expansum]KGO71055.1 hypothetical protein PEX1_020240 [Penicillium expansum]
MHLAIEFPKLSFLKADVYILFQLLYIEKSISQIKPISAFFCRLCMELKKASKISIKKTAR